LNAGLAFLLASCPCAFVISIPLAYFSCIGLNSKNNVLIKGDKYIDVLAKTKAIVFDKTGTLTTGKLHVSKIQTFNNYSEELVLKYVSSFESYSNHPIAKAIISYYPANLKIKNYYEKPGYGIQGYIDNHFVLCGNEILLKKHQVKVPNMLPHDLTSVYLAIDYQIAGII